MLCCGWCCSVSLVCVRGVNLFCCVLVLHLSLWFVSVCVILFGVVLLCCVASCCSVCNFVLFVLFGLLCLVLLCVLFCV